MPRTLGDSFIHISRLNYIVPVNYPLNELPESPAGDETIVKIASHIADMIPDGATMQLGIGDIPNGVLKFLYSKKDLGIHTELFSNSVMELSEAGVITNARKSIHKGKIIAGFILGNQKLYQWVHNNPMIETHRTEYVNDPFVIAQNDRMVAINSAIEVDIDRPSLCGLASFQNFTAVKADKWISFTIFPSRRSLPIIALPSTTLPKTRWQRKLP
jgi:acetyl-CoA hydrolase